MIWQINDIVECCLQGLLFLYSSRQKLTVFVKKIALIKECGGLVFVVLYFYACMTRHDRIRHDTIPYYTIPYHTIPYYCMVWYGMVWYSMVSCHTIPYHVSQKAHAKLINRNLKLITIIYNIHILRTIT